MSCVYTSDELELLDFQPPTEEEVEGLTDEEFNIILATFPGNNYGAICWCTWIGGDLGCDSVTPS